MAEKKLPNIAIFDFDDTLVYSDTLLTFLSVLIGHFKSKSFLAYSILIGITKWALTNFSSQYDYKTDIKKRWLRLCLKDIRMDAVKTAIPILIQNTKWKDEILKILKSHIEKKDLIVIATGALDIYIIDLLKSLQKKLNLKFDYAYVIYTQAEIKSNKLTGNLLGKNTVRFTKKNLIKSYLDQTPHHESFGYGNAPNDLPFLKICTHKMII